MNFKRLEEIGYGLLGNRQSRCFHVAFLFRKNRIISIAFNKIKGHTKVHKHDYHKNCGIHAELGCFLKAGLNNYKDHKLAVLRIDRNDKLNYSRPCKWCLGATRQFGVSDIYYTTKEGKWVYEEIN